MKWILIAGLYIGLASCSKEKKPLAFDLPPDFNAPLRLPSAIGTKENPYERFEFEKQQLVDPLTGEIPDEIYEREAAFTDDIKTQSELYPNLRIQEQEWTLVGPNNVGGRTRALAIDVSNEQVILAGGVAGGMFRSENGGTTWTRTTRSSIINGSTCMVQDTKNQHIWYFGTGEVLGSGTASIYPPGNGIYKSTNGGKAWKALPATSADTSKIRDNFRFVWNLAMNPANSSGNEIYAAVYGGVWRSADGGEKWRLVLGDSSRNEGASTYTDIMITPAGEMYAYLSVRIRGDDNIKYAARSSRRGIFYSTDGVDWGDISPSDLLPYAERLVMSYAPQNQDIVYFLLVGGASLSGNLITPGKKNQLWRLDGTQTNVLDAWQDRSSSIPSKVDQHIAAFDTQSSYNLVIKVHPNDSNVVFIGGTNLYRSTDGFASKSHITHIGGYDVKDTLKIYTNNHPDQHQIVFYKNANRMLLGNDGGVFRTDDNRSSKVAWTPLNEGYITTQFYSVALSPIKGNALTMGGMQDNGTYIRFKGENKNWTRLLTGDGAYCAITSDNLAIYGSFQKGRVLSVKPSDDGETVSFTRVDPAGVDKKDYLFIAPFMLDPNNNHRMYLAAGRDVWRNDNLSQIDAGNSTPTPINWSRMRFMIQNPERISQYNLESLFQNRKISTLNVSATPANILYTGTSTGFVLKTDSALSNNAATRVIFIHPKTRTSKKPVYVSSIAVDPTDANRLLITYSNYKVISVYASIDGGETITDVSGNLEQKPPYGTGAGPSVKWAEIIPLKENKYKYYVGTSAGLYSTGELKGTSTQWVKESKNRIGKSNVAMIDYRSSDGRIVAATHGNGVFQSTVENTLDLTPKAATQTSQTLIVQNGYPNPFNPQKTTFTLSFNNLSVGTVTVLIIDTSGSIVRRLMNGVQFKGDVKATWDGKNDSGAPVASGMYIYMLLKDNQSYTGKIILL